MSQWNHVVIWLIQQFIKFKNYTSFKNFQELNAWNIVVDVESVYKRASMSTAAAADN